MRVLVTGASGFVGKHLIRELLRHDHEPLAFDLVPARSLPVSVPGFTGDILNAELLLRLVARIRPDACVHLGGISFVPEGWHNPERMLSVNVLGAIHLLEAFRKSSAGAHILVISSAEVYGCRPRSHPITEQELLDPDNPYAVSKAAADQMSLLYASYHGMHIMTARPCNHIGPGQSPQFVVPSFAEQLLAIARKKTAPVLKAGNLENLRDFTDVRDIVRAYRLLIESGKAGQAYNIASGRAVPIQTILDQLGGIIGVTPSVERDPNRYRPLEHRPQIAIGKIAADINWKPDIPLEVTLRDVVAELNRSPTPPT
ncbi:MAG: GDP-mannose 4,6-dehydratase [Verrucomicrobia bacterium]|nr:GDP-mannose 4,6-dehydratase [Verrucomicrobiota bacterium]MBU4291107.1 GDP-mannose 4,6-dehydratase [Verrucomicrobiota bacterium]MBU4429910.1 GDP-mannose 4,6-dehydratase [Verrucomicrobiota bacterium]MBU4498144.1 GDP-mannose 4,6-dehydratase [Verrucomicrobiota bacterium]MCG2680124.1 GDP-mannose 4,6-dehydratase [Kiritimatiellia bacterium]